MAGYDLLGGMRQQMGGQGQDMESVKRALIQQYMQSQASPMGGQGEMPQATAQPMMAPQAGMPQQLGQAPQANPLSSMLANIGNNAAPASQYLRPAGLNAPYNQMAPYSGMPPYGTR